MPGKGYRKRQYQARQMGKKARLKNAFAALKANVQKNSKMLKNTIEGKQIYRETSSSLADNTFTYYNILDGLAPGVADTGSGATVETGARIGNSINVKTISLRMSLDGTKYGATSLNPNAKSGGQHRVIIYDSPCGEQLDATHILREVDSAFTGIRSHYETKIAQGKKYKIWYDEVINLSDAKPAVFLHFVKKWKDGKKVLYDGTSTSPSNFFPRVMVVSNNVPPGSQNSFSFSFKCKFEDM